MRSQRRAIVVGGSMAGLFAALALRQRGWQVEVFERNATALAGRGAGIVTHARLDAALASVGVAGGSDIGVSIGERRLLDRDGRGLRTLGYPQTATSWDRLLQSLRATLPDAHYHLGRGLAEVETTADGVVATLTDGSVVAADLLVAADGIRSTVRGLLSPSATLEYAGYVAWRGLVEETALSSQARETLMSCMAFCLPSGEQMLGYPVAGDGNRLAVGERRFNFVWYRRAEPTLALPRLLTDRHGKRHDMSVPPPLVSLSVIAEMRAAAVATLAPAFAEAVSKAPMPFFQPIYDLDVPTMVVGRVALIGDAAFVVRPHVGGGVTKAAEDAIALAEALDGQDIDAGLAQFDAERRPAGAIMVQRGRNLGAELDKRAAAPPDAIDVLRDTASLAFLD